MKSSKTRNYQVAASASRINSILKDPNDFVSKDEVPNSDSLSFDNGFYVKSTAVFIDLRGSSELYGNSVRKRTIARIIKAFLSEAVAILNSSDLCEYVYIEGDCVWGILNTKTTLEFQKSINVAMQLAALPSLLNSVGKKVVSNYISISAGVGVAFGESLMVKGGNKGSSINEVVWIGEVVAKAAKLCSIASKNGRKTLVIDENTYYKLPESYKKYFTVFYHPNYKLAYESTYVDGDMSGWTKQNV